MSTYDGRIAMKTEVTPNLLRYGLPVSRVVVSVIGFKTPHEYTLGLGPVVEP